MNRDSNESLIVILFRVSLKGNAGKKDQKLETYPAGGGCVSFIFHVKGGFFEGIGRPISCAEGVMMSASINHGESVY